MRPQYSQYFSREDEKSDNGSCSKNKKKGIFMTFAEYFQLKSDHRAEGWEA